jgi:hypothetical protein
VKIFRDNLLKGKHGDPIEDGPPLRRGNALILAMVASEECQKKKGDQETVEKFSETGQFFDDFTPFFVCAIRRIDPCGFRT